MTIQIGTAHINLKGRVSTVAPDLTGTIFLCSWAKHSTLTVPFGSSTDLTFFTLHTQILGDHSCRFNIRIDQQYTDNLWLESERK